MWQKIASPPCNIPTHNWTQQVFISPKACSHWSKGAFLGRQNPWLLSPERTSWGSHYRQHRWNPLDQSPAFRVGSRGRGGLMTIISTHLSTQEPSWVLAVLHSPACVTDKCESTIKTCLIDSKNVIPIESLLGLRSTGIQRLEDPPWLCVQSIYRDDTFRVRHPHASNNIGNSNTSYHGLSTAAVPSTVTMTSRDCMWIVCVIVSYLFYRWEKGGTGRIKLLPIRTHMVSDGARVWWISISQTPGHLPGAPTGSMPVPRQD